MKNFLVIGCGRFGRSVAVTLVNMGSRVTIMDSDEATVQQLSDKVSYAVQGNATDINTLKMLKLKSFDGVVVGIGTDTKTSVLVIINLQELGVKNVIVKAINKTHAKMLELMNVGRVVYPEIDKGIRLAHSLSTRNLLDYLEISPEHSIVEIIALPSWIGSNLMELDFRTQYSVNVMAIKRGDRVMLSLDPEDVITKNDILVVLGHNKDLECLEAEAIKGENNI